MKNRITSLCFIICTLIILSLNMHAQSPGTGTHPNSGPATNSVVGLNQIYSGTGKYTLSADGVGSMADAMNIRVNKPNAAATVAKAFLMSATIDYELPTSCITLASAPITWNGSVSYQLSDYFNYFYNYYADVTSMVAPIIDAFPAGISTLPITECHNIDGEALLVVFNDASATEKTIIIMFGGLNTGGDNFSLTLGTPINPAAPGVLMDMGLGISFSYQEPGAMGEQRTLIDVNGTRLTSSAGGSDDAVDTPYNGNLMTVGGIGDSDANPPDPNSFVYNARQDDELYSLLPFITNTTTNILVNTNNPTNDDNIFLSYFVISGSAIIGQGIVLSQNTTSGPVNVSHTVYAHAVDSQGAPVTGRSITFTVVSGPNAGTLGTAVTDVNGLASITYTGTTVGTDVIKGCMSPTKSAQICSNTLSYDWTIMTNVPTMSQWGLILLAFALLGVGTAYILRKKSTDVAI